MRITMTADLAHAAAMDAGNASMRKAGREHWNDDDNAAALAVTDRLAPYVPGWTPENPLICTPPSVTGPVTARHARA